MTTRTPQDHLPKKTAAERETEKNGTVTITWRDLKFTIPANVDDVDGEFLKFAADGDSYRMVATVLDPKQFKQFKAAKPKIGDYKIVGDQIAELYGFNDQGE